MSFLKKKSCVNQELEIITKMFKTKDVKESDKIFYFTWAKHKSNNIAIKNTQRTVFKSIIFTWTKCKGQRINPKTWTHPDKN